MAKNFDIIIVGGGPIGIACGLEAKKKGLSFLIIEKGVITNSIYNYPKNMQFFSSSEKLELHDIPFISKEAKPKRDEALEYYRRIVTSNNLAIHLFEKVLKIDATKNGFQVSTSKDSYISTYLIIATGFYDLPNILDVPGENLPKVSHYYEDPHFYAKQQLAVVGASNSAVDAALECYRKGANVSLIIRGDEIGKRVKYWVKPDIENRIEEGSIKVYYNTEIVEVKKDELILIENKKGIFSIKNDYVLALTGYRPNFNFLEKAGVRLSDNAKKKPAYDPDTMESNVKNLYLAGVICGGMDTHVWFIENSRIHASIIIDDIKQKSSERQISV